MIVFDRVAVELGTILVLLGFEVFITEFTVFVGVRVDVGVGF
jgi:hypothetical protein